MNLEKFLELVFNTPNNISIQYSNIDGEEKLIVNGEDLTKSEIKFDDSIIKEKIANFKKKIEKLDDCVYEKVLNKVEENGYDLCDMTKALELESFTLQDEQDANNIISILSNIIQETLKEEIQMLVELSEQF